MVFDPWLHRWSPISTSPCCHQRDRAPCYPPTSTREFVCDEKLLMSKAHLSILSILYGATFPYTVAHPKVSTRASGPEGHCVECRLPTCHHQRSPKWPSMGKLISFSISSICMIWKISSVEICRSRFRHLCSWSYCTLVNFWNKYVCLCPIRSLVLLTCRSCYC